MFARLSRSLFSSAARCPPKTVPLSMVRVSRRTMSATSHAAAKSSDTPWIIGSLVVFGPALLYLLSPSARKHTHGVHDDHHEFPALKQHQEPETESPAATEDGEDTEDANVASSLTVPPESDGPTSPESQGEVPAAVNTEEGQVLVNEEGATTPEVQASGEATEGSQDKSGEGPTNSSKAEASAEK